MFSKDDPISEWLAAGCAALVSEDVTHELVSRLEALEWNRIGSGVDWEKYQHVKLDLGDEESEELNSWVSTTRLKDDTHIILLLKPAEPSIVLPIAFAMENFDSAFWGRPGRRYMFGASVVSGVLTQHPSHMIEWNGADLLRAFS